MDDVDAVLSDGGTRSLQVGDHIGIGKQIAHAVYRIVRCVEFARDFSVDHVSEQNLNTLPAVCVRDGLLRVMHHSRAFVVARHTEPVLRKRPQKAT